MYHNQLKLLEGSILFLEIDYQFICTPEFHQDWNQSVANMAAW